MIFKSYILEQSFDAIKKTNLFLFYGENQGLKKEFKEKIKKEFKNEEILNLFQDEILKNENILLNEINNRSLFDTKKIIIINQASDKIFDLIEDCSSSLKEDTVFGFIPVCVAIEFFNLSKGPTLFLVKKVVIFSIKESSVLFLAICTITVSGTLKLV